MPHSNDRVRIQVPVSQDLALEIETLGKTLRRSQRWMATELLNVVVEDRQKLEDYLAMRVLAFIREATHVLIGKTTSTDTTNGKVVHLDLSLPTQTAAFIETLAKKLGHTTAKMAGVMLYWGVQENDFAIRLLAGPLLAAHRGLMALAEGTNVAPMKEAA